MLEAKIVAHTRNPIWVANLVIVEKKRWKENECWFQKFDLIVTKKGQLSSTLHGAYITKGDNVENDVNVGLVFKLQSNKGSEGGLT